MVLKAEGGRPGFGAHEPTGIPLNVALMSIPDESDVSFALPGHEETRIEIGQLAFSVSINAGNTFLKAQALRCALVIGLRYSSCSRGEIGRQPDWLDRRVEAPPRSPSLHRRTQLRVARNTDQ